MTHALTRRGFGALAGASLLASPAIAQARRITFLLDWAPLGYHGAWFLADDRGYFRREGLAVQFDRGFGSGGVVTRLGGGAADFGFGDPGAAVVFNAANPDKGSAGVFQLWSKTMAGIITLAGKGITKPSDLLGKRIAAPVADGARTLWPAFARANNLPVDGVTWLTVQPSLREPMLLRGECDAIAAFTSGAFFNLVAAGAKADDVIMLRYPDHGVDVMGNALLATHAVMTREPELVRAVLRATLAGTRDMLRDVDAATAAVARREPLTNVPVENARTRFIMTESMVTPDVRAHGIGYVAPGRGEGMVRLIAEAFAVANPPAVSAVFRDDFLPAAADRALPTA